jgi:hypothetical protein
MARQADTEANERYEMNVCRPGMCICILHFQQLNFSFIIHLPRIASTIKILFQICSVYYLLWGNPADMDFQDDYSLLGKSESEAGN